MMRDHFVADGELYSIGKDLNFLVEVTGIPQTLSIKLVESVTSRRIEDPIASQIKVKQKFEF